MVKFINELMHVQNTVMRARYHLTASQRGHITFTQCFFLRLHVRMFDSLKRIHLSHNTLDSSTYECFGSHFAVAH